jgi:hypothetical protein
MGIYRVFAGSDGESHIEEQRQEEYPALGALTNIREVRVQQFDGTRQMDFHPLPERRLIIHLSGEVKIGTSDGVPTRVSRWRHPPDGRRDRTRAHARGPQPILRRLHSPQGLGRGSVSCTCACGAGQAAADRAGLSRQ